MTFYALNINCVPGLNIKNTLKLALLSVCKIYEEILDMGKIQTKDI